MSLHADVAVTRGMLRVEVELSADVDETVAILGPNGSGKSTLVAVLAGLLEAERDRVEVDGRDLTGVPPERRPIGVLFQDRVLFPHLSALENVAFPLRAKGVPRADARRRAIELLGTFSVAERAAALPRELSGGEAQRVALARALIAEPRLLLLDEPSSALDVEARGRFRAVLAGILRSFTGVRVLVTHDPIEAMTLADRLVLIERGRITQSGSPDEIRRAPRTSYAADVVGVNLFAGHLERLPDGAGRLVTPDGDLTIGWPPGASDPLDDVVAILRPVDVALHRSMPEGSARNVLRGTVSEIAIEGERARVRVRSTPPVVAEITVGSAERLEIIEDADVWVSFKAVEVRVVQPLEPAAGTLGG